MAAISLTLLNFSRLETCPYQSTTEIQVMSFCVKQNISMENPVQLSISYATRRIYVFVALGVFYIFYLTLYNTI